MVAEAERSGPVVDLLDDIVVALPQDPIAPGRDANLLPDLKNSAPMNHERKIETTDDVSYSSVPLLYLYVGKNVILASL